MGGFDVKAATDAVGAFLGQHWTFVVAGLVLLFLFRSTGFFARLRHVIEELFFSNWQLALLGSTAIALSLASGYTTWDGLRNFTQLPGLSLLIAFGIQGVMLIVAWLIGESFATGMNQNVGSSGRRTRPLEATVGMLLGVALAGVVFYWVLAQYNAVSWSKAASFSADWTKFADVSLYYLLGLIVVAIVAFNFKRGGDISVPYVQSVRVIAKSAVLWVMLFASMAASVFFSFDSHFNAIFPADARKRAAEIRTLNQIGGVVADVGALTQKRQIEEAESLFNTDGWKTYDKQLAGLAQVSQGSQGEIEKYFVQKMEDRRRGIVEQQERIAGSERNQTALLRKRDELEAELQRIEPNIGALEADLARAQSTHSETKQSMAAKRIDASAEDGGVEGTLKRGKGPIFRQRMTELEELQRKLTITDEPRLKEAQKQRDQSSARIVSLKREIATINGEVAKYRGESETAGQRIKSAQETSGDDQIKVDPARVLPAFERARAAFRQQPDTERLGMLQQQCMNLSNAMASTPATKDKVRGIDCDPKQAAEAAARVFALNAGLVAYNTNCAGGDKLARYSSTDALLGFGRKCLQDSGLISKDSVNIGTRLQGIDMNRDDKAHRFVVTWNAFLDGNRLAYLALVLAIGIDALVFMAGLFGAAAVKSPLSDVPSPKARSAHQLEAIIEAALLPDAFNKARIAREAMRPIAHNDGYTNEVRLNELDPETAAHVRDVLNAGATIAAVRHTDQPGHYLVRAELYEFLCDVIKRELKNKPEETKRGLELNELETRMTEALLPRVGETADAVLQHLHPIDEKNGFTSEIFMNEIEPYNTRPVRNVLTAGSSLGVVQRDKKESDRYYVHANLYKTLARIRAKELVAASHAALQARSGGQLQEQRVSLPPAAARGQIEHQRPNGSAARDRGGANGSLAGRLAGSNGRFHAVDERVAQVDDQSPRETSVSEAVIEAFATELEVSPDYLWELLGSPHQEIADQVGQLISSLCEREPLFRKEIEPLVQGKRMAIEAARKSLMASLDYEDRSTAERLAGYFSDVVHLLPFWEDGDYETVLLHVIEQGQLTANRALLASQPDMWLGLVQDHYDSIRRQPRRNRQDWQRVIMMLNDLSEKLDKLRMSDVPPDLPKHMHS